MLPPSDVIAALAGGALIGTAALILLLFNGRIAGISGAVKGLLAPQRSGDLSWRLAFIAGLVSGGAAMFFLLPEHFANHSGRPIGLVGAAGFLVGLGSALANGCTSGHGICGVGRLAPRSMLATALFIAAGMATSAAVGLVGGGP
jgi:uncharacterized membrane protein YedE/YeeE